MVMPMDAFIKPASSEMEMEATLILGESIKIADWNLTDIDYIMPMGPPTGNNGTYPKAGHYPAIFGERSARIQSTKKLSIPDTLSCCSRAKKQYIAILSLQTNISFSQI